jgi:uncharacterized membrane protein YphA (DoxX/SURF4 family)
MMTVSEKQIVEETTHFSKSKGFASGYDFDLLLLAVPVSLLLTGPGKPSIEWNLLKRECKRGQNH